MRIFTLLMSFLILPLGALAADIAIKDPYIPAPPPRAKSAAAYMTIANSGDTSDVLLSAQIKDGRAMIHKTETDASGVTRMVHQMNGVEVPANGMAMLVPGGLHVMLMGLSEPLMAGHPLSVTLTFQTAGDITLEVPVLKRGDTPAPSEDHRSMDHGHADHGDHKTNDEAATED